MVSCPTYVVRRELLFRSLCTVAYVSAAGSTTRGFCGRLGRPVRGVVTSGPCVARMADSYTDTKKPHAIVFNPIVGVVAAVSGIAFVFAGSRKIGAV